MSFTLTSTAPETSKLYLTPSKRRRRPDETQSTTYSIRELHSWTFSAESIVACAIHDVLNMRKNAVDNYEFFWLGRIPCRSVKIVGMVVGIQVHERKTTYTVDDGTGVVDCVQLHRPVKPPSNVISKYIDAKTPPEPFSPVAEIGQTVRVTGNVRLQYDNRAISINQIDRRPSPNEELLHSRLVQELRRTNYTSKEPFVIPRRAEKSSYESPLKTLPKPSTRKDPPSSVSSSPVKSSPITDHETTVTFLSNIQSTPKLRHPFRLHTHDLTENTFRIYVKHYMDHATDTFEYESDSMIQTCLEKMPDTPTKLSRLVSPLDTPRQSYHYASSTTPKGHTYQRDRGISTERAKHEGFTISYLRRVPELSLLAYRVVQAVANRREREKRKQSKVVISSSKSSLSSSVVTIAPDKLAGNMKRLFQWAIIQLLREGCIILWDGPLRPLPDSKSMITDTTRLWNSKPHTSLADDNFFGSDSMSLNDHPMSGYISDPEPDEESYIPLTPTRLSEHVIEAIQFIVELKADKGNPYAGATAEGILNVLRKDDRWQYIGLWNIQDALDVLRGQGAVWDMGKGRWDLTD